MSDQATTVTEPTAESEAVLAVADRLADEGRLIDAVDLVHLANRALHSPRLEHRLVELRRDAMKGGEPAPGREAWPPEVPDVFGGDGIPEVTGDELTSEALAAGIVHHGALLVRNLVPPSWVERLTGDIDQALAGHDRWRETKDPADSEPWFVPFSGGGEPADEHALMFARRWTRSGGGAWFVDSPRACFDVLEAYEEVGLRRIIGEYLGERPAFNVKKSTLRCTPVDLNGADWHQDGAFLGEGIRTMNVWLALTPCGGYDADAPGLDVVPRRLDEIQETGTRGAWFEWSVSQEIVDELTVDAPVVRPMFQPGDALLFDEMNLHRTALEPDMATPRYALESWFFAPSCYHDDELPLLW